MVEGISNRRTGVNDARALTAFLAPQEGYTPLQLAIAREFPLVAKLLRDAGAIESSGGSESRAERLRSADSIEPSEGGEGRAE